MNRLLKIIVDGQADLRCSVCDSVEHMDRRGNGTRGGLNDVCKACFYIWYDGVGPCERPEHRDQIPHVHGEDILAFNLKAKAAGTWPFDGQQLR